MAVPSCILNASGATFPRLDTVERIAYALGLSPAFLAYGVESDGSQPTEGLDAAKVASRLRQTRAARGLTMRALARAAGLTDTAVDPPRRGPACPALRLSKRLRQPSVCRQGGSATESGRWNYLDEGVRQRRLRQVP